MNVSQGDLAYIVAPSEREESHGRIVEVIEYRGIINYLDHGDQPTWACKFNGTIVAFTNDGTGVVSDKIIIPDFCLRRIAGPDLKQEIETEQTIKEK